MKELIIKNLHASVEGKEILKGVNLEIHDREMVALLGPNGHGKSTLLAVIMGNPKYQVTEGSITLDGEDVLKMKVDERAKKGLFLAMQYPSEVPGVVNAEFLKAAINARRDNPIKIFEFYRELEKASQKVNISMDMANRFLNEGFSGGEKKRNEILQMLVLNPKLAILDETDSGLDVDAIKIVSKGIEMFKNDDNAVLIITHNTRILNHLKVDYVHVLVNGQIVKTSTAELAEQIEETGYAQYKK